MIDIAVSNLSKEFEVGKKILDGFTFQIDQGERVGLLGKNGAGKTTLFKILTGELDWDEGEVHIAPGKGVGLISQIPVYPPEYTVEDVLQTAFERLHAMEDELAELAGRMGEDSDPALLRRYDTLTAAFEAGGGYDTITRLNKVCNGLLISQDMRGQLFSSLSGGEKTRVNLARLILEDTDILLLDEPTNHLDLRATEWLEEYLDKYKGTVLAISHDRWFLDRVVKRVIEIQEGKAEFYEGNYSFYVVEKERRYQEKLKQYEKEQAKIGQLQEAADKLHLWAFMGNDKLHKRAFSMEKRIERLRTTDRPTRERRLDMRFGEREFRGDEVLTVKELKKSFDGRTLFDNVDLEVVGGERIALLGDNGTLDPTQTPEMVEAMRQLIGHAHVITPNLTEAAFLLDEPYRPDISPDGLKEQLRRLAAMGPDRVVITSAPAARPGHCAAVAYDREQGRFWKMESPYIPAFYPGTGDTFSSVLVGAFLQGDSLPVALERAVRFVTLGIRVTYGYDTRHSDGVLLERTLPALQDRCAIGEYEAF